MIYFCCVFPPMCFQLAEKGRNTVVGSRCKCRLKEGRGAGILGLLIITWGEKAENLGITLSANFAIAPSGEQVVPSA